MRLVSLRSAQIAAMGVLRVVLVRARLTEDQHLYTRGLKEDGKDGYGRQILEGLSQGCNNRSMAMWTERTKIKPITKTFMSEMLTEIQQADNELYGDSTKACLLFADLPSDSGEVLHPARKVLAENRKENDGNSASRVILAIGPERGWTSKEVQAFTQESNFVRTSFGSSVLRVDTATIAGVSIIQSIL